MSPRLTFRLVLVLLAGLVVFRAFPFVWWPSTHFDSDQAIVGLMAKHISEGRAFPLYFYGQHYMLAVEAYLAAPVMAVIGATVTALKLPLVAINIAAVLLLARAAVRDAGLTPLMAAVAALPLALPASPIAARVTEANGGNVEPWLYVVLMWMLRTQPWALGVVIGIGALHREFAMYGVAALLILEALDTLGAPARVNRLSDAARRWTMAGLAAMAVVSVASIAHPFASAMGPGTSGDDARLLAIATDPVGGRLCFDPSLWPERTRLLWTDHLPRIVGGTPAALREYGVLTGVFAGRTGVGAWVLAITLFGLASGVRLLWPVRNLRESAASPRLGFYLVLVGLISTVVYGFATCSDIRVATMRYNLLGVLVPVGALVLAFQAWRTPAVRAGLSAAVVLWCTFNALDVAALTREYMRQPLVDDRRVVTEELEARGVTTAWAAFRDAYHITFMTKERVRVSANDYIRITAYADEARAAGAPTLTERSCENGVPVAGMRLCP